MPQFLPHEALTVGDPNFPIVIPHVVGTIIQSTLTEVQFQTQVDSGQWIICDGRDITGSELSTLTGASTAPDMVGRTLAMAGQADAEDAKVLNSQLDSQNLIHRHTFSGTYTTDASGLGTNILRPFGTFSTSEEGGDEARPYTYVVNMFIKIN